MKKERIENYKSSYIYVDYFCDKCESKLDHWKLITCNDCGISLCNDCSDIQSFNIAGYTRKYCPKCYSIHDTDIKEIQDLYQKIEEKQKHLKVLLKNNFDIETNENEE